MKSDDEKSDGDHYSLRIGFFPVRDPIADYPIVWPIIKPGWKPPQFPDRPISWWDALFVGYSVSDEVFWCNEFQVNFSKTIIQYENSSIKDVEYEVDGKWRTGEYVGWMYALYTTANILTAGLASFAWSEGWLNIFNRGKYHARKFINVTEYKWKQDIVIDIAIDCNGIVTEYDKKAYPPDRPPDIDGKDTVLTEEFYGDPQRGDPDPLQDSWVGEATTNVEKATEYYEAATGMPFGPTITVMSPGETVITPVKIQTTSTTPQLQIDNTPLALTTPEELLTSYQIIVELNDPDGETVIAAFPSGQPHSNVDVALKGSYVAGRYTHPGYTLNELQALQANGTPIPRDEFYNTFGIELPAGVSECIITNVNIDYDTTGSLYGDTTYQTGIYVGSPQDKVYYPSNAKEGTITVMHR